MQRFVTRRLVTASADGWTFGWPRKESTVGAKSFLKAPYSNSEISQGKLCKMYDNILLNLREMLIPMCANDDQSLHSEGFECYFKRILDSLWTV